MIYSFLSDSNFSSKLLPSFPSFNPFNVIGSILFPDLILIFPEPTLLVLLLKIWDGEKLKTGPTGLSKYPKLFAVSIESCPVA